MDSEAYRHHKIEPKILELLEVKWAMVQHPAATAQVLHELSDSDSIHILVRIAEHPKAHPDTLAKLASHSHPDVRAAVTENANTPMEVLTALVNDECLDVRYRLAENHQIPSAYLSALSNDQNPYVAYRAERTLARIEGASMVLNTLFNTSPPLAKQSRQSA